MKLLHRIIFWSHLLAGIIGGLVIFIMSATGVILMYEHQLVEYAERDVREIPPSDTHAQRLSLDDLIANAREQNPGVQVTGVVLRKTRLLLSPLASAPTAPPMSTPIPARC